MKELSSKEKGNLTELQCITEFVKNGITVNIPYGNNARYDFIAEIKGQLFKIQVKTPRKSESDDTKFMIECETSHVVSKKTVHRRYNENEVDFFATYYQGKCYLIPFNECSRSKTLRFVPPINGNTKNINWAKDYLLQEMIEKYTI